MSWKYLMVVLSIISSNFYFGGGFGPVGAFAVDAVGIGVTQDVLLETPPTPVQSGGGAGGYIAVIGSAAPVRNNPVAIDAVKISNNELKWTTSGPAKCQARWGETLDYEIAILSETSFLITHDVALSDFKTDLEYNLLLECVSEGNALTTRAYVFRGPSRIAPSLSTLPQPAAVITPPITKGPIRAASQSGLNARRSSAPVPVFVGAAPQKLSVTESILPPPDEIRTPHNPAKGLLLPDPRSDRLLLPRAPRAGLISPITMFMNQIINFITGLFRSLYGQ